LIKRKKQQSAYDLVEQIVVKEATVVVTVEEEAEIAEAIEADKEEEKQVVQDGRVSKCRQNSRKSGGTSGYYPNLRKR
jgi:hypothetical protein